jgi:putative hydrolase of HD superfamily
MKMVILHDLAESIVGDYMPGDISAPEKTRQEKAAMESILAGLPDSVRAEYTEIWTEYLNNKTAVSRFVHRIDKLEMAMQASSYSQQGHSRELLAPFFISALTAMKDGSNDIVSQTLARFASAR